MLSSYLLILNLAYMSTLTTSPPGFANGRAVRLGLGFPGSWYSSVRAGGRVSDSRAGVARRETVPCGMVGLSVYGSDYGLVGVFSFAGVEVITPHCG